MTSLQRGRFSTYHLDWYNMICLLTWYGMAIFCFWPISSELAGLCQINNQHDLQLKKIDSQEVVILNPKTKMFNIFLLGLCFCFVFTGFNTLSQTQVGPAKNMNWTSFELTSKILSSICPQNLIYDGAESYVDNFNVNGLVTWVNSC